MVLIVLAVIVLLALVGGWVMSSVATTNQAQAAVEAARAAQIASAAQLETARSNSILVVALIVLLVLGVAIVGFLVYRLARVQRMVQQTGIGPGAFGKWQPGPNANFQRQQMPQMLGSGDATQMMMAMMAMQMMNQQMQQGQRQQPTQAILPYEVPKAEEPSDSGLWGWG